METQSPNLSLQGPHRGLLPHLQPQPVPRASLTLKITASVSKHLPPPAQGSTPTPLWYPHDNPRRKLVLPSFTDASNGAREVRQKFCGATLPEALQGQEDILISCEEADTQSTEPCAQINGSTKNPGLRVPWPVWSAPQWTPSPWRAH